MQEDKESNRIMNVYIFQSWCIYKTVLLEDFYKSIYLTTYLSFLSGYPSETST